MNWYIEPENQNRLWNTIHRIPIVSTIPLNFRENTFRSIVEYNYNHFKKPMNISEKTKINRDTISSFMEKIAPFEKKEMRDLQYEVKPETLEKDDVIENMDELIKKYQSEREMDLNILAPEFLKSPKVSFSNVPVIIAPRSFTVLEETVLQTEDLGSPDTPEKNFVQLTKERVVECYHLLENSVDEKILEKFRIIKDSMDEYLRENV